MPTANPPRPLDFIIQRSSYGLKTDELYYQLLGGVAKVPRRGWYHYYSTGIDVKTQVDFTVNIVKNSGVKYHFFWADYETAYNNLNADSARDIVYMTNEVEQRTGLPSMLYTNPAIWNAYLEPFTALHRLLKVAIAQYYYYPNPDTKSPSLPKNCTNWKMWQYGITGSYYNKENGTAYGSGNIHLDLDTYNGTVEELDAFLGLSGVVPPVSTIDITAELATIRAELDKIQAKVG